MAETDVTMANSSDDAPTCASDGFWCEGTNNIQKKSAAAAATTATPAATTATAAATTAAAGATAAATTGATGATAAPAAAAAAGAERSAAAKGGAGGGGGEAGTQQKQAGKKNKRKAAKRTSAGHPSSSSSSSSSPSSAGAAAEETAAAEAETPPAAAAADGAGNKKTGGGDTARKENVGEVSMETRKEEEDESEKEVDEEDDIGGKEPPKDEMEDGMSADTAGSPFSDNDDDDLPTDKTKDDEEEDEYSDKSPEERVKLASASKDQGNDIFRAGGAVADAMKAYKSGLKYVKDVYLPEAKSLRVALNSNVAMCCLKLEEWQQAIAAADAALQDEPANVKALYRRGLARASFGLYTDAKADLLQVLRMEPRNADARKELEKLKEKIAKDNTERRKAYSGLFDRAAGMYADREAQMQRKRQEEAEKEAKLRKEWEEEMEKKKEKGEDEVPFEDWKEEKEKAREKEKRREAAQHTDSPGRRRRNTAEARKADSLELDEEDKKIIDETKKMGYCYFRRDLTEEERKLNAQHLPTKIDPSAPSADAAGASAAPNSVAGGAAAAANSAAPNESSSNAHDENAAKAKQQSGVSSWNAKGTTYEEKDMSQWARQRFSSRLLETRIVSPGNQELMKDPTALLSALPNMGMPANKRKEDASKMLRSLVNQFLRTEVWCTEVKDLSGDAQVVVMRGSKRYLFEFSCTLLFEIAARPEHMTDPQMRERFPQMKDDGFTYSGEMTLPEVSSAEGKGEAWLSGCKLKIKKKVAAEHKDLIDQGVKLFKKKLVDQIHLFLDDFSKAA